MFTDRLDAGRFFARLRAFALACPRCSRVAVIRRQSALALLGPSDVALAVHELRAAGCGLVLTLGIVAPGSR